MEVSINPPIRKIKTEEIPLTIVTLVKNPEIYEENVLKSTAKHKDTIEYITTYHNSSASASLNTGLEIASNDIVMTCHQDVYFKEGWYESLKLHLNSITDWGVCGFAGATWDGKLVGTHSGLGMKNKIIPVQTLDGSTLILQKHNNLKFDENLKYFHMYDVDISLQAHEKDLEVYCLNVPVYHISYRMTGGGFPESLEYIKNKWRDKVGLICSTVGNY